MLRMLISQNTVCVIYDVCCDAKEKERIGCFLRPVSVAA